MTSAERKLAWEPLSNIEFHMDCALMDFVADRILKDASGT